MIALYEYGTKTRYFESLDATLAYATERGMRLFWLNWTAYQLIP